MSAAAPTATRARPVEDVQRLWKDRIQRARDARKPYEPTWLSNLAFAAGQHHLVWDRVAGQMRNIKDADPRQATRNLLTADRISEYRDAQLGELTSDDDREQFLVAQESETAEESAKELNQAAAYQWDHEVDADEVLSQVYEYVVDLGTAAVRCSWDPNHGPVVDHQPFDSQGAPVKPDTHPEDWQTLQQTGQLADGSLPEMRPVREGRTRWQPYTAVQILSPPGFNHEARFPWDILVDVVTIDDLVDTYGPKAEGLTEDRDIASAAGLSTSQSVKDQRSQGGSGGQGRLRGSVWRYICFQRPNREHPQGQVVTIVSNDYTVLEVRDGLDYQLPNGEPHTGVVYFHWRRLIDRFYSRAWIEPLKDPQRALNNDETNADETVARGGNKVFMREQDVLENPTGLPMEVIRMKDNSQQPYFFEGMGLPPALVQRRQMLLDNIQHAATLSPLALGENPQNVDTYSQLALLNENESGKRSYIRRGHKRAIATLQTLSVWDIRKYWPDEKKILVSGDDDSIAQQTFKKAGVPDFYMVKVAKGAPQPRSQAAELKKIDAFWAAAEQSGLVIQDPAAWVSWYVESVNAGEAQEIPEPQADSQTQMAEYENLLMRHGETPIPADYDLMPVHLPKHREAQDQARAADDLELFMRIQQHLDASVVVQQENAAKVAQHQQTPSPLAPPSINPNGNGQGAPNPVFVGPDFQRLAAGN